MFDVRRFQLDVCTNRIYCGDVYTSCDECISCITLYKVHYYYLRRKDAERQARYRANLKEKCSVIKSV